MPRSAFKELKHVSVPLEAALRERTTLWPAGLSRAPGRGLARVPGFEDLFDMFGMVPSSEVAHRRAGASPRIDSDTI